MQLTLLFRSGLIRVLDGLKMVDDRSGMPHHLGKGATRLGELERGMDHQQGTEPGIQAKDQSKASQLHHHLQHRYQYPKAGISVLGPLLLTIHLEVPPFFQPAWII